MTKPILYGAPISPFVRKVVVVLIEKKVDYELQAFFPRQAPEGYRKISPLGKIPAYKDDKMAVADSSIISFYLEKRHPNPPLYPSDPMELVRALWFEEFADNGLSAGLGGLVFQRLLAPKLLGQPTDEAAVKDILDNKAPPLLGYLEGEVRDGKWLVGEHYSIADISVSSFVINFESAGGKIDAAKYPKLAAYLKRAYSHPSFAKAIELEKPFFKQFMAA